ncbi:MAG: PIN domain-containing protein [Candidatus Diapherotrites archaeon]|uniref:PIN domain-containing protein n=1 Tax=Candidatus Iainarchaeum sp. TaxID=3101447 RepID=A0A8T3YKZ7_9ARCH|nr:PIN domain-containing protein [Candidatus Diapherotrites archaeon]
MLLDTNAWIEYFKGTKKGLQVREILHSKQCYTCSISLAELSEWIEKENIDRSEKLNGVKSQSTIVFPDARTLESAGIIKCRKRKTFKDFGMIDAIILATAKTYGLQIVTGDSHFKDENVFML